MRPLLTFILVFFLFSEAFAEPWSFDRAGQQPTGFLAGFLSGYAAHELGHIIVARTKGIDTEFDGVTIVYPDAVMTDAEHLQVASAGLQSQWLASEMTLRYREGRKLGRFGDNFTAGVVMSHLAISAAYLTVLKNHEDGDIEGMANATGISNDRLAALIAIPALLDAWRLFGNDVPAWVPAISLGSKGVGMAVIWSY